MKRSLHTTSAVDVQALLVRIPSPSWGNLALLAGVATQRRRSGPTSSTVAKWSIAGMPIAAFQLVDAKLLLWECRIATWDEIVGTPLKDLLLQKWSRLNKRKTGDA